MLDMIHLGVYSAHTSLLCQLVGKRLDEINIDKSEVKGIIYSNLLKNWFA